MPFVRTKHQLPRVWDACWNVPATGLSDIALAVGQNTAAQHTRAIDVTDATAEKGDECRGN
jgi:hypothetical protein